MSFVGKANTNVEVNLHTKSPNTQPLHNPLLLCKSEALNTNPESYETQASQVKMRTHTVSVVERLYSLTLATLPCRAKLLSLLFRNFVEE